VLELAAAGPGAEGQGLADATSSPTASSPSAEGHQVADGRQLAEKARIKSS
jgi:hypothetical protein